MNQIPATLLKKIILLFLVAILLPISVFGFEIYAPVNPASKETIAFTVEKGWGNGDIADKLEESGIIRSSYFFKLYTFLSLKHFTLQAGRYNLSPKMSINQIANKMAKGDVIKNKLIILEGWNVKDIGKYLETMGVCAQADFISLANGDYANEFAFLKDRPRNVSLEGYFFPDTYELAESQGCSDLIGMMLSNFDKKLTSDLRAEIIRQKKTIFDVVTMASLIEKEVRIMEERKIVSGILWKRLSIGMPLQLDATVNYVTGKSDPSATIKDTNIDSPYNTYKYRGLPKGPISNPGIKSITAALYPEKTDYWFYLSNGKTIFSRTLDEHNAAKAKYLGS